MQEFIAAEVQLCLSRTTWTTLSCEIMIPLESATAILPKMPSSRTLTGDFHLTLDVNSKATGSPSITSSPVYRLLRSRNQRRNISASSVRSSCCSRAECRMLVPKRVEVCQLKGTASQGKDEESVALQLSPNNCPRIFSESNKSSQDKSTPNNGVSISQERNASTLEESPGEKQTNKQTTTMQKPMKPIFKVFSTTQVVTRKALNSQTWTDMWTLISPMPVQCFINWAIRPSGSW